MVCKARLFNGKNPTGVDVCVRIDRVHMIIEQDGGQQKLPLPDITLRKAGFDEKGLACSWEEEGGNVEIQILDPNDVQILLRGMPEDLAAQYRTIAKQHRKVKRWRGVGFLAVLLFLCLPFIALLLFYLKADTLANWASSMTPIEAEVMIGSESIKYLKSDLTLSQEGQRWEIIDTLGDTLSKNAQFNYQFYLSEDEEVNAFALPGGFVVVNSGLVANCETLEQLAGVLAHEIQHVEQRHSLEAIYKQLGFDAMWSVVIGDMSGIVSLIASDLAELSFSRDAEREADIEGFKALHKANINPVGMVDFFAKLGHSHSSDSQWLSTHPSNHERAETLGSMIKKNDTHSYPDLSRTLDIQWPLALD